jgi:hypothetical protein
MRAHFVETLRFYCGKIKTQRCEKFALFPAGPAENNYEDYWELSHMMRSFFPKRCLNPKP